MDSDQDSLLLMTQVCPVAATEWPSVGQFAGVSATQLIHVATAIVTAAAVGLVVAFV